MEIEVREPIAVYEKTKLTAEEYLEFEKKSLEKHEFFEGEVFAMACGRKAQCAFFKYFRGIGLSVERKILQALRERFAHPHPGKHFVHLSRYFDYLRGNHPFGKR